MKLRKGYKQTDIGVIPQEWDCTKINTLVQLGIIEKPLDGNHGNIHPTSGDYVDEGIPFIMANDIQKGKIDLKNCHFIRKEQADKLQKGFSFTGDVLLTHKGTIGNVAIVQQIFTDYIMLTPQVTYYRVIDKNKLDYRHLKHFFESNQYQKTLKNISEGGTRAYIGITNQRELFISIPSLPEQKAIAEALSDTDAFITALDAVIEKKRLLKQGTMQQLLTGKTRLEGFTEKWVTKTLGDLANVVGGGTPSTFNSEYWNGHINWFTPTEIGKNKYSFESVRKITKKGFDSSSAILLPKGTILLTSRAGIGDLSILTEQSCTNQGFQSLIAKEITDNEFLYYLVSTLKNEFLKNASGSTFLEISPSKVKAVPIFIPPTVSEQKAIAEILSDMDNEIAALEAKRQKYKAIKQGMMQDLLTGNIRLIG